MTRILAAGLALAAASAAQAETAAFLDDRSSAASVVTSLYNAIDRHEYLRAWSYFAEGAAAPYPAFRDGYADTASVEIRIGPVASEGAAGSVHSKVPVALRAVATDGTTTVYVGCYRLTQVQPALQDTPPYRPIRIEEGRLARTALPFATPMGACD